MKTRYWIEPDDLQWILKREFETDTKGDDCRLTGNKRMKTEVVGYYPKAKQAIGRLLECRTHESGSVDLSDSISLDELVATIDNATAEIRAM